MVEIWNLLESLWSGLQEPLWPEHVWLLPEVRISHDPAWQLDLHRENGTGTPELCPGPPWMLCWYTVHVYKRPEWTVSSSWAAPAKQPDGMSFVASTSVQNYAFRHALSSSLAGHDADQGRSSSLLITVHRTNPQYSTLLPDQVDCSQWVLGYIVVTQLHILKWKSDI